MLLAGAETGNSFIPRLWARHHLDHLLQQGSSPEIREQIIALSEGYQIITPYTSFLVLESDADRERFGVTKRFRMRDAEEFFAAGRELANFELARKQMLLAKQWRQRIRESVLAALAAMERQRTEELREQPYFYALDSSGYAYGPYGGRLGTRLREYEKNKGLGTGFCLEDADEGEYLGYDTGEEGWEEDFEDLGLDFEELEADEFMPEMAKRADMPASRPYRLPESATPSMRRRLKRSIYDRYADRGRDLGWEGKRGLYWTAGTAGKYHYAAGTISSFGGECVPYGAYDQLEWIFPAVPGPRGVEPESAWAEEVQQFLETLDRRQVIAKLEGGLHLHTEATRLDRRDREFDDGKGDSYLAADQWLVVPPHVQGQDYQTQWLLGEERGVLSAAWLLGRVREKRERDEVSWPAPFRWYFHETFRDHFSYSAQLQQREDGKLELTLQHPDQDEYKTVLVIDPEKAAVLEVLQYCQEELSSATVFSEFVEAGGAWWPGLLTEKDKEGKVLRTTTVTVTLLRRRPPDQLRHRARATGRRRRRPHLPAENRASERPLDGL